MKDFIVNLGFLVLGTGVLIYSYINFIGDDLTIVASYVTCVMGYFAHDLFN
jgi:hypothetical protein